MKRSHQSWWKRVIRFLASLRLAVFTILLLGVISAVGTVYEARYDAYYAQQVVYFSLWMKIALGLLCVSLISVMVDRWPWKKRHTGFVFAHIGILILIFGSWVTQKYGVDGSMAFRPGQTNRYVQISERELTVHASSNGERWAMLASRPVNFLKTPPSRENPVELETGENDFKVIDYVYAALPDVQVKPTDKQGDGPALRFQLQNPQVSFTEWIVDSDGQGVEEMDMGPAKVVLSSGDYEPQEGNQLIFKPLDDSEKVEYAIFSGDQGGVTKEGVLEAGDSVETGWMGLKLRVLKYLPHAEQKVEYVPKERPTDQTVSAVRVAFDGNEHWVGLNSVYRFFSENMAYVFSYANRRIDVGFEMRLKDFRVGRYQGTMRAASYESLVEVEGRGEHLISMNEPLQYNGFTFYQASFEEDETGRPTKSILSVNYDPGRPIKYLGSFLIVLGAVILFWFKRMQVRSKGKKSVTKGARSEAS